MKEFRNRLKIQNILFILGIIVLVVVQVMSYTGKIIPPEKSNALDFIKGFIEGASAVLTIFFVVGVVINLRAFKSEEKLKKLYVKETDERVNAIATKGKSSGASVALCTMLVGAVISGYFSMVVFITMLSCVFFLAMSMCIGKIYYSGKM